VFVSGEPALIGVQQDAGVSCNLAGLSRFEPARQLSPRLEPAFRRLCFRWAALPKSAHAGAKKTLAEIYNAENKDHADKAARAFAADYGAKRLPGRALGASAHHQPNRGFPYSAFNCAGRSAY
jgi:hypothetical protein